MIIRLANTDDIEALRPLVGAYSIETAAQGTERNDELLLDAILYGIRAGEAVVVAEQFDELIGWCAWVHLPLSPPGKVEGLGTYVVDGMRQEYVSRDLRKFAEEHARGRGYRYVEGCAANDNVAGFQSVMRLGFKVVGQLVRKEF